MSKKKTANSKIKSRISYARASGLFDTAVRWVCDALFEFGQKRLLSAPQCRMLDTRGRVCDLRAGHWQREIVSRSHHRGGARQAHFRQSFGQVLHKTGRCICIVVVSPCTGPQKADGVLSGHIPFWHHGLRQRPGFPFGLVREFVPFFGSAISVEECATVPVCGARRCGEPATASNGYTFASRLAHTSGDVARR